MCLRPTRIFHIIKSILTVSQSSNDGIYPGQAVIHPFFDYWLTILLAVCSIRMQQMRPQRYEQNMWTRKSMGISMLMFFINTYLRHIRKVCRKYCRRTIAVCVRTHEIKNILRCNVNWLISCRWLCYKDNSGEKKINENESHLFVTLRKALGEKGAIAGYAYFPSVEIAWGYSKW